MRRDVGGHADGDAGGTVDQQVRETAREHGRLLGLAVVVGHEIDGVLVDVAHHFHGERGHTAFGVTHGGRRVVARGAEVALTVHKRIAHGPRLGHTHKRVVDGGVAVRVVFTHNVADDAGALVVAAIRAVSAVVHRVDDATVDRLHAVTHVRQRAFHDDGQCVGEVGFAHFLLQINRLDALAFHQAVIGVVGFLRAQRLVVVVQPVELVVIARPAVFRGVGVVFVCHGRSFVFLSILFGWLA